MENTLQKSLGFILGKRVVSTVAHEDEQSVVLQFDDGTSCRLIAGSGMGEVFMELEIICRWPDPE